MKVLVASFCKICLAKNVRDTIRRVISFTLILTNHLRYLRDEIMKLNNK